VPIGGHGLEVLEKGPPRSQLSADEPVTLIPQLQQGVQAEGQQVHRQQQAGEMLLAVTEVVFQVIAPVLEHVVVFVLDLPARPPGGHQPGHVVGADDPVGDEGVAVFDLPVGVGDGQFAPVDFEGVVAVGQRHAMGPAIVVVFPAVDFAFDAQFQGGQRAARFQSFNPGSQMGVGSGFAGEQEMEAVQEHLAAEGLVGVEIVAQQSVIAGVIAEGVGAQPAFGRGDFTILLGLAVLRGDELRAQRHDLGVAGAEDDGGDGAVVMSGGSVGVVKGRAVLALDILGLGGEIPGAVQGDEAGIAHRAHGFEQPVFVEGAMQVVKEAKQVFGRDRIQAVADVIVGGNALDLEQGAGVVLSAVLFHELLEAQEGGALGEENREGTKRDVGQGVLSVIARARVRQLGGDRTQALDELIEAARVHGDKQCLKAVRGTSYNRVTMMANA